MSTLVRAALLLPIWIFMAYGIAVIGVAVHDYMQRGK